MRRWGSSCRRIHLMRCRRRRCRRRRSCRCCLRHCQVSKQVTLVQNEGESESESESESEIVLGGILRRCDVGGGPETATEMWAFQFDPQEVVRGAPFRVHVKSELFFLFHRDPRLHLNKKSIVFFHFRRLVSFSPFREAWCRVFVAKLPRWRDTHLRVCLHAPAAE